MRLVKLPEIGQQGLAFYLAMEEYIAKNICKLVPANEYGQREAFFIWQVEPTVIFGRNQVMEAEVNVPYCREHGIRIVRRKSGGGCVYSDKGNIMISCVSDYKEVAFSFDRFLQRIVLMLKNLGLDARRSGRNDVMVGGRKVSGNAFFLLPEAGIVHGTMLFDSDFEAMMNAITPSKDKIRSKGVESVREHVTNLREELLKIGKPVDIGTFKRYLSDSLSDGSAPVFMDGCQVDAIREIEKKYSDGEFLRGRHHSYSIERHGKVDNVGELDVKLDMAGDKIEGMHLAGDFFPLKEKVDEMLSARLKGRPDDIEAAREALEGLAMDDWVMNLTNRAFLEVAFRKNKGDKQ